MHRCTSAALSMAFLLGLAGPALAQGHAAPTAARTAAPPEESGDALSNPAFHGGEVVAFMGLRSGDRVADVVAGRFARLVAQTVGPTGVVYAVEPDEVVKAHPQVLSMMQGLASSPQYADLKVVTGTIDRLQLPGGLDAVFIRQNYHDLHDRFMGPADVAAFNRHVFRALKPGGVYVILDHAAAAGSGLSATQTLHRIDPETVKAEVEAAGFRFDGSSPALANAADPHDKIVFDPSIRGHTDQFLFRFRKPG